MNKLAAQLRELADRMEKLDIGEVGVDCTFTIFGGYDPTCLNQDRLQKAVDTFKGDGAVEPVVHEGSTWVRLRDGDLQTVIHYPPDVFGYEEVVQRVPVKLDLAKLLED